MTHHQGVGYSSLVHSGSGNITQNFEKKNNVEIEYDILKLYHSVSEIKLTIKNLIENEIANTVDLMLNNRINAIVKERQISDLFLLEKQIEKNTVLSKDVISKVLSNRAEFLLSEEQIITHFPEFQKIRYFFL